MYPTIDIRFANWDMLGIEFIDLNERKYMAKAEYAILKPRGVIESAEGTAVLIDSYSTDKDGKRVAEALRNLTGARVDLIDKESEEKQNLSSRAYGFTNWSKSSWVPTGPTPPWARQAERN